MKTSSKLVLTLLACLLYVSLKAQVFPFYCQSNVIKVVDVSKKPLINPFAGGLMFPYITSLDLNFDGKQDIVLIDRADNRVLTFINATDSGKIKYLYFPYYERFLPDTLSSFIDFKDYNHDNKPDLYAYATYSPPGFELYKNTTLGNSLSFKKVTDQLLCNYACDTIDTFAIAIYTSTTNQSAIADIDGDGDLDIISYDQLGAWLCYYRNNSMEKYHVPDSLDFSFIDEYWGYCMESGLTDSSDMHGYRPWACKKYPCPHYSHLIKSPDSVIVTNVTGSTHKRHNGGTLFVHDMDGNGDLDAILGDLSYPHVKLLKNGKNKFKLCVDSMISQNDTFPPSHPVKINYMPGIYYQDVDNDGVKDFIFSPLDQNKTVPFQNLHHIWLYKNTGNDSDVNLQFIQNDFLIDQMIQTGGSTSPAFFDYDGDSDLDMFVVTKGSYSQTSYNHDHILLYKNIGKKDSNVFQLADTNYLNLYSMGLQNLSIAFGDIDGDGSTDLLLGTLSGKFIYYHNNAKPWQPANFTLSSNNFGGITIPGGYSTAAIADINKDSLNDIVAGGFYGRLYYYQNTGTKLNPSYTLISDTFMKIFSSGGDHYMAPAIADLNNDGKLDMVVAYNEYNHNAGFYFGKLDFYYNITDKPGSPVVPKDTMIRYLINGKPSLINTKSVGKGLKPAIVDLDGDHIPDLVLGSDRGGLTFYGSNSSIFTQITADKPTVLCLGDTITLDAGPGFDTYTWNNNEKTQVIKITVAGNYSCTVSRGGLTYTADITIKAHPVPLTADYDYTNTKLKYNFAPINTDIDSIYWDFGDGFSSWQLNPVHTFATGGKYTVCMFVRDHCHDTARACKLLTTVGIANQSNTPLLKIYPNPAYVQLNIQLSNVTSQGRFELRMIDVMGKTVRTALLNPDKLFILDIKSLSVGIYQVLILNNGQIIAQKKVLVRK